LASINPLSYSVDALRWALINQSHFGIVKDVVVMVLALVVCTYFAVNRFNRIQV
jgi:diacylglycerol kinase